MSELLETRMALQETRRQLDAALARVRQLEGELESTKSEWDATDGAHPCWWRGHDNGAKGTRQRWATRAREMARTWHVRTASGESAMNAFADEMEATLR